MRKTLYPLFGIITVLNTPFTDADAVDLLALRRHVDAAIAVMSPAFSCRRWPPRSTS